MSSMVRKSLRSLLLLLALAPVGSRAQDAGAPAQNSSAPIRSSSSNAPVGSAPVQDGSEWDRARAALMATPMSNMAQAIERWKLLVSSDRFSFADYAGFVMAYPGFPEETKLRGSAERAIEREALSSSQVAAFFDRFPPLSNQARAQYALALNALGRSEARQQALAAWRGGVMSDTAESTLLAQLSATLTPADHDARMDALLWAGATAQAERQLLYVSPAARPAFAARLSMIKGQDPVVAGLDPGAGAQLDAGYLYNRSRFLRAGGQGYTAAAMLASRGALAASPRDPRRWIAEQLAAARAGDAASAVRIAALIDDAFAPGTDVSRESFAVRDDYTSLVWLGGTQALNVLGDGARAAPLFWRYGAAARTPQTRSKGFYWAGRAMAQAGNGAESSRYFELAAAYPDQYYGMLALERLGRPLPAYAGYPKTIPTQAEREAFSGRALTGAVREVARESDWPTAVRFFREISEQAVTEGDHVLVADLARELGRRDLAVILGQSAHIDGFGDFQKISFPLIPIPQGANWTMVHAITRQESQFAANAVSHAGARGLMQLMPGTAREQAGKMYLDYDAQALTGDAGYNLALGDAYFRRLLDRFDGSYPLAIAAYNAGAGNVNKWLRANGDPRNGGIDWVDWIERIPITETRGYVQHVLENAVVYEAMNPARASYKGPNPLSHFLGKNNPG